MPDRISTEHTADKLALSNGNAARSAQSSWFGKRWNSLPFRWQILIAISAVTLLASLLSGVFAVIDARTRADVETQSNIELWANHIAARVSGIKSADELPALANQLELELANVRHVSISIRGPNGGAIIPTAHPATKDHRATEERAPAWFIELVQPDIESRQVDMKPDGNLIGSVVINGVPDDEIAESWELLQMLALLWLGASAAMMVGLYFILGLVLHPLARLDSGMRELEIGHYAFRLDMPRVRELESIAASFNELAAALGEVNAENSRLYRQLVAVQEEERREISRDLHDEFGPCIFGIMAATTAVSRHAKTLPVAQSKPILDCTEEIVRVSHHLKSLNRGLLNRLRPVALGRNTITDLVTELVATFERRHRGVVFDLSAEDMPTTFGEAIDLTIYRCVQEGITNAIRHGTAQDIKIVLAITGPPRAPLVEVQVRDDGRGIAENTPFGYGLSSMRERVSKLSGAMEIGPIKPHGTILAVRIPLPDPANAGEEPTADA